MAAQPTTFVADIAKVMGVGALDTDTIARIPTSALVAASTGTFATPGTGNEFVTKLDPKIAPQTIDVRVFGALCDGPTDDTVAVLNAVAAILAQTTPRTTTLFFPGYCRLRQTIVITQPATFGVSISLKGIGKNAIGILWDPYPEYADEPAIRVDGRATANGPVDGFSLEKMFLRLKPGAANYSGGGHGIHLIGTTVDASIADTRVREFRGASTTSGLLDGAAGGCGIYIESGEINAVTQNLHLLNVQLQACDIGLRVGNVAALNAHKLELNQNTKHGLLMESGGAFSWDGGMVQGQHAGASMKFKPAGLRQISGLDFKGLYIESNTTGYAPYISAFGNDAGRVLVVDQADDTGQGVWNAKFAALGLSPPGVEAFSLTKCVGVELHDFDGRVSGHQIGTLTGCREVLLDGVGTTEDLVTQTGCTNVRFGREAGTGTALRVSAGGIVPASYVQGGEDAALSDASITINKSTGRPRVRIAGHHYDLETVGYTPSFSQLFASISKCRIDPAREVFDVTGSNINFVTASDGSVFTGVNSPTRNTSDTDLNNQKTIVCSKSGTKILRAVSLSPVLAASHTNPWLSMVLKIRTLASTDEGICSMFNTGSSDVFVSYQDATNLTALWVGDTGFAADTHTRDASPHWILTGIDATGHPCLYIDGVSVAVGSDIGSYVAAQIDGVLIGADTAGTFTGLSPRPTDVTFGYWELLSSRPSDDLIAFAQTVAAERWGI